jgi:3-methylcrotonyl-CoA carboxylase alpha subunit|tara:strand:+ start:1223 stop:1684 length:462 start_codon:yes stop_codon:yes gene_type:complete
MLHEFKVNSEMVEVTVARDGQDWLLGDYKAQILDDGRIMVHNADGRSRIAHSAKVGDVWWVHIDGHIFCIEKTEAGSADGDSDGGMTAPMPGKILEVKVTNGQSVTAGELLLVMEAMKMEHRIVAPSDGVVTMVNFSTGDQVQQGDVLVEMSE